MVTASHLPFNRNGLKFFTRQGGLEREDITQILLLAESGNFKSLPSQGKLFKTDLISVYCDSLVHKVREEVNHPEHYSEPLKGFRIVVDAGNGAGGFFSERVLRPLGADTTGSQFLEPDGRFPNHVPNPEDGEAMESLRSAVIDNNADFGVIFDADVDRAGAVDGRGKEINRNRLIALMAAIVLEEHPGSTIVTDSVTSTGLKKFIEEVLGGIHHRFKRGYKNVIDEANRLNNEGRECWLAMETSGHGALGENYFLDDGAYLVTKILIKMAKLGLKEGKGIETLIESLEEPAESREFRLNINAEGFGEYGRGVLSALKEYASSRAGWSMAPDNYEGVRINVDKNSGNGWFLLRMSLHDPLMPLNIESDSHGGLAVIVTSLSEFLRRYPGLDISSLEQFFNGKHR
jgi:phosphomannomutase